MFIRIIKMLTNLNVALPSAPVSDVPETVPLQTVQMKEFICHVCFVQETSLPRVYKLFRALGLRHLVVVDDSNRVGFVLAQVFFFPFTSLFNVNPLFPD